MSEATTVVSTSRAEKMRARWADPEYRAKMLAAAARGAATTNARRRSTPSIPQESTGGPEAAKAPAAEATAIATPPSADRTAPVSPDPPKNEGARPKGWRPWKTRSR